MEVKMKAYGVQFNVVKTKGMRTNDREIIKVTTKEEKVKQVDKSDI